MVCLVQYLYPEQFPLQTLQISFISLTKKLIIELILTDGHQILTCVYSAENAEIKIYFVIYSGNTETKCLQTTITGKICKNVKHYLTILSALFRNDSI